MHPPPHKLDFYRLAVQHPLAEAAFLERVYRHYRGRAATLLREDFAGTAAVAAAWAAMIPDGQALAVERHGSTARWARRRVVRELGERARDVHVVQTDVMKLTRPRVDVIAALNFSTFIYHDRDLLRNYFAHARRSLLPGGVLVIDAYGGPGAMRVGLQRRRVNPLPQEGVGSFEYQWEQRSYDAVTGRVDCRIHFRMSGGRRRLIPNAFVYDWRLWALPELTELMRAAGFKRSEVWCPRKVGDSWFQPVRHMDPREDWVAYVVGV